MARTPFRLPDEHEADDLVAKMFRGLGDPTRLRLLEALAAGGERTVSDLVEAVDLPQPKVSSHLAALRWCGFVATRREHRAVHYRIADERVLQLVTTVRGVLVDQERLPRGPDAEPEPEPEPVAPAPRAEPGLHVLFELGDEECAVPVGQVRETLLYTPPHRLPSALPGFLGMQNVRGEVIGVFDLAGLIGHDAGPPASLLVVVAGDRVAGLAVGRIRGVHELAADDLRPPVSRVVGVTALATGPRGLVLVLDAAAVVPPLSATARG
jgi:ArsR family transcriptional regulator, cadmium/lead-responsive transcriptional repressor